MYNNLDQFQTALGQALSVPVQQARTNAKTRSLLEAAKSGDQAKVDRIASQMTTAELQAVQKELRR